MNFLNLLPHEITHKLLIFFSSRFSQKVVVLFVCYYFYQHNHHEYKPQNSSITAVSAKGHWKRQNGCPLHLLSSSLHYLDNDHLAGEKIILRFKDEFRRRLALESIEIVELSNRHDFKFILPWDTKKWSHQKSLLSFPTLQMYWSLILKRFMLLLAPSIINSLA